MFGKEPAVIVNGLAELVRQVLPLAVVVGLIELSPEKLAGWVSIIGFVLAFVSTYLIRTSVVSTEIANSQIETAIGMPKTSTLADVMAAEKVKESKGEV